MLCQVSLHWPISCTRCGTRRNTAAFLASSLASGITGTMVHVDKGFHSMALPANVDAILAALDKA